LVSTLVFLGQEQGDDTSIKIADFGFAKKVPRPNCLRTLCGTAQYVAPEVLELKDTGYDTRADMWSVGVVVYILLGGYAPFEGPVDLLAQAIISGEYEFHEKYWDEISTDAKDMISNLLQVNPEKRLTADDALQSPWMILEDEALNTKDLSGAQRQLKENKAKEPGPPAPVSSVVFKQSFRWSCFVLTWIVYWYRLLEWEVKLAPWEPPSRLRWSTSLTLKLVKSSPR
jgi:serine/threonine protein kinase